MKKSGYNFGVTFSYCYLPSYNILHCLGDNVLCNDALENLNHSWNHHRILGPQGCVPVENKQLRAAELIPAVSEAVKMCEEREGSLTYDVTFGTDPLIMRLDLIESHERLFFSIQPTGQNILIC